MRYLFLLLALSSCATEQATLTTPAALFAQATDTTARPLVLSGKFKGPVTVVLQTGSGNSANLADNRKAGQNQGSAATAPAAQSGNASKRSGGPSPWWYVVAAVVGAVGWEYASQRLRLTKWLPWRGQALTH